jgi:hypothetical protein
MNCQTCAHWQLKGAYLAEHGFGRCKLEKPPFDRAREFSASAPCNKGQHTPATERVIAVRIKALKGASQ